MLLTSEPIAPSSGIPAPWWAPALRLAILATAGDAEFCAWVRRSGFGQALASGVVDVDAFDAFMGRVKPPYRFDGPAHQVMSFARSRERGFAACLDGAAWAAAALISLRASRRGVVCVESPSGIDYAHARVVVDGVDILDAYPEGRPAGVAPSCESVACVFDLMGASTAAAAWHGVRRA